MNESQRTDTQQRAAEMDDLAPWEEIEAGRFMPRRIRGSFRGLAMG